MKKILLCLLICSSIHSWAQIDFGAACTIIQKLDEKIYKMDYKALSIKDRIDRNKAIKAEIDSLENIDANERLEDSLSIRVEGLRILEVVRGNLFDILEIGKKDFDINQLENKLACIVRTETITWLEFALSLKIKEIETYIERWKLGKIKEPIQYKHANESLKTYKDIFDIVRKRVDEIMPSEMAFYKFTETSNQFLKYIRIEHNNDFLAMYNDDRDFTGGFRFEFATDHLKMRLFSSFTDRVRNPNSRSWYSYQSIFLVMYG